MAYASDARVGVLACASPIPGGDPRGSRCSRSSFLADQEPAGAGRRHDDLDGQDDHVGAATAVSVWRRVRDPVPVRAAPVLVPAVDIDGRVRVWRAGSAGGALSDPVRIARPAPPALP